MRGEKNGCKRLYKEFASSEWRIYNYSKKSGHMETTVL